MIADLFQSLQQAAPVIVSLIIIEGLLSVDNMLAIASLASQLPESQKRIALRLGLIGAYVFRGVALLGVSVILSHEWVKLVGAAYLIHLMAEHFSEMEEDGDAAVHEPRTFWKTVITIQFMDLSLSVDNVVTAVAMSPQLWVVNTGVFLGLLTLWLFATVSLELVERFPILKHTAFLLIGYVGAILIVEMTGEYWIHRHIHITSLEKFVGIAVIVTLSLWYAKSAGLQRACKPVFHLLLKPLKLYEKFASFVIALIVWPFKAALGKAK